MSSAGDQAAPQPSISVMVTTFQGARFLGEQLTSIVAQERPADEIVVCDDGSTDGGPELARDLLKGAGIPVTVTVNPHRLGVVANVESGIRCTSGDLIVLADQDDVWLPGHLKAVEAALAAGVPAAVFCNAELVDAQSRPLPGTLWDALTVSSEERGLIAAGRVFEVLLRRNVVTGATLALHRSLLPALLPFSPDGLHDRWIGLIAAATGRLSAIASSQVRYRLHDDNAVGVGAVTLADEVAARRERTGLRAAELAFHRAVAERLRAIGAPPESTAALQAKVDHLAFRLALPERRLRRPIPVARELHRGAYRRYARGARSALWDVWYGGA